MIRYLVATVGLLGVLGTVDAYAASQEFSGVAPSGAWYHIQIPDGWQAGGPLVMYQHGLDFSVATNPPGLGPLSDVMQAEGYAIAATSYRQKGWALFTAIPDNQELLHQFEQVAGTPGEIVPFGGSLGGLIALKLAEAPGFPPVKGSYALCPAASGARIWNTAIDLRLAYDVVCHGAGELPSGSQPLPWALDLDQIPADLGDLLDQAQLALALVSLNQCTGINLPPYLRNDAMQRRLTQLMAFAHITDENFFLTNMGYAIYVMSDLVRAPDKLGGRNPFTTVGVDYGSDPAIDAGIARISADPLAAARLRAVSDFHGEVGDAKVLSMHTSRDQLVIPANEEFVRNVLPAGQATIAIVDEDAPTHCGFSDAEGLAGWEALRAWKDGAAQPTVADLQQGCTDLAASGDVDGACRFDSGAQIAPFDSIVRPRPSPPVHPLEHSTHAYPAVLPHAGRGRLDRDAAEAPRIAADTAAAPPQPPYIHSPHAFPAALLLPHGERATAPPPVNGPSEAQRMTAATATAQDTSLCQAIQPFYWEIGDRGSRKVDGSLGFLAPVSATPMNIASASKWIYSAYVLQRQGGVLSDSDIKFLNFRSGYVSFVPPTCPFATTVDDCLNIADNGLYTSSEDGRFFYGSGHMQKHASLLGLGSFTDTALAGELASTIGDFGFDYTQPQLAGGVYADADGYAAFLRAILAGDLQIGSKLGDDPVCTNPRTCASADYTPVPETESWHYSLGHWVEDDPVFGDGAFSSAGTYGFYPWIDSSKTWYGIIARQVTQSTNGEQEGYVSAQCGRLIRKAWVTGTVQ